MLWEHVRFPGKRKGKTNIFYETFLKLLAMLQIIPYVFCALLCANGQPTGYYFTYSSNQNTQSNVQEDTTASIENGAYIYPYEE